jgi:hypothetical protein
VAVTLYHVYGQDLQLSPSGGLLLADDSGTVATASQQRLVRIVMTAPRMFDQSGTPIARGDDLFNQGFGAGLPALVDELVDQTVLFGIKTAILNAIAIDPNFSKTPAPQVTFSQPDPQTLLVFVAATTVSGQPVATPPIPLTVGG